MRRPAGGAAPLAVHLKLMCPQCGPLDGFYRRQPQALTLRCPHCGTAGVYHNYVGDCRARGPLPFYVRPPAAEGPP